MLALQGYTICLYNEFEEITDISCGLHYLGGVTLAHNQERFEMLLHERGQHLFVGLTTKIVNLKESTKNAPVKNIDRIIGGLYDPLDGHLDPSGTNYACAKATRMGGATIEIKTKLMETNQRNDGNWDLVTDLRNKYRTYC